MDQLALHIEYLLRRNDCVILPGVGAFISVHIPARYDKEAATWHPMTQEIRFNQAVNQDDGLLANSYARKYSLPFHEARVLLDSDICSMLTFIEHDGEVSLGRLGVLSRGEGNSFVFSPLYSQVFSGKEVGLIPVCIKPQASVIQDSPMSATDEKIEEESDFTPQARIFDTSKNYYIAINKVFAKVACSLVAICVAALFVILNTDNRIGEDKASVLPVSEIMDTTSSLTESKTQAVQSYVINNDEHNMTCAEDAVNKDPLVSPTDKKRFHLIVGTFKTEEEAKKFLTIKSASGAELQIIPSKTLWRVSMDSSDDKSELITRLNTREVSKNFEGAWIFEDKSAL